MAQKKLPWFRIYTNNTAALKTIDSAKLGDALKAAMDYFDSNGQQAGIEAGISDPITLLAFRLLKQGADDSIQEHRARIEDGKKGAAAKREKENQMQQQISMYQQQYGGDEPEPVIKDFVIPGIDEELPFQT